MEITLTEVTSGYNLSKINTNFKILEDTLNNRIVHRDGTNELEADLDFNGFSALNVGSLLIGDRDIIAEIENAYSEIDDFLITTDNLLREIEAILSGQLQDRNQGNGQYSTQLTEDLVAGTVFTIPNDLQYIVGRNSLRISYQGVMCYPTYQYDEVGTFDTPSNQIRFNITIPAYSHLNIWISGVGNIVQIKEDLELAFAEYTEYVTTTRDEVEGMKNSVDDSEENVTALEANVVAIGANVEDWKDIALEASNNAQTWAEGTDEAVVAIGGEHSSKVWSLMAKDSADRAEEIKQQIGTPISVRGRVDSVQDLPTEGVDNGDMYFVGTEGDDNLAEYVWIDNKWEYLGTVGISIPNASETDRGSVRLATQDEVDTRVGEGVITASKLPTTTALEARVTTNETDIDNLEDSVLTKSQITNCITEIPQDIKLELADGTLTLKAGSKVYVPNGFESDGTTPKFDYVTVNNDANGGTGAREHMYTYHPTLSSFGATPKTHCISGDTAPETPTSGMFWYDTTNNIVKRYIDDAWVDGYSLPLCIATTSGIDQVFNGFGYIGSTIFRLPNVKGLRPNGRNADGTLNNIEFTTPRVFTYTQTTDGSYDLLLNNVRIMPVADSYWNYDEERNIFVGDSGVVRQGMNAGRIVVESGVITSLKPKLPFRAIDYSDKAEVAGWAMPSDKFVALTNGADSTTYTAPANGLVWMHVTGATGSVFFGINVRNEADTFTVFSATSRTESAGAYVAIAPVRKGQKFQIIYNTTTLENLRFIYAEGAK